MPNSYSPPEIPGIKRYKVIACEIFTREISLLIAQCSNIINVSFIRKGLHDAETEVMRKALQDEIDKTEDKYDAILLAYGRCNNGLVEIKANGVQLVIPKIHSCIGAFLGGNEQFMDFFADNCSTFYRSSGWLERDFYDDDAIVNKLGMAKSYEEYEKKYGPDNAKYIMETLGTWHKNYKKLVYIDFGLKIDEKYRKIAENEAQNLGLAFETIKGRLDLLADLLDGNWDKQRFLVVPPEGKIIADDNEVMILG